MWWRAAYTSLLFCLSVGSATERDSAGGDQGSVGRETGGRVQLVSKQPVSMSKWQMAASKFRISLTWCARQRPATRLSSTRRRRRAIQTEGKKMELKCLGGHNPPPPKSRRFKISQRCFTPIMLQTSPQSRPFLFFSRLRQTRWVHTEILITYVFYKRNIVCEVHNMPTYNISTSTIY